MLQSSALGYSLFMLPLVKADVYVLVSTMYLSDVVFSPTLSWLLVVVVGACGASLCSRNTLEFCMTRMSSGPFSIEKAAMPSNSRVERSTRSICV